MNAEKSTSQQLENQRLSLERQNKDLKAKVQELENQAKIKQKSMIAALEGKIANLEDQLDQDNKSVYLFLFHFIFYLLILFFKESIL